MKKTTKQLIEKHIKDDEMVFQQLNNTLGSIAEHIKVSNDHMAKTNEFMSGLGWLSDISEGTRLLKRPSLWLIALVVGMVALLGGVKALWLYFLALVTPK